MDNYFPVSRATGSLLYGLYGRTATGTFPIWPALLEKAVAMAWNGYDNLVETVDSRVTDDRIFSTFGVAPLATQSKLVLTGKTETAVSAFLTKPFTQGATFVAASPTHNMAVIGVDKDGLILADPRSAPRTTEQWGTPFKAGSGDRTLFLNRNWDKNNDSDKFPMHLTWTVALDWLYRLSGYDTPKPDTEGKDKDKD